MLNTEIRYLALRRYGCVGLDAYVADGIRSLTEISAESQRFTARASIKGEEFGIGRSLEIGRAGGAGDNVAIAEYRQVGKLFARKKRQNILEGVVKEGAGRAHEKSE